MKLWKRKASETEDVQRAAVYSAIRDVENGGEMPDSIEYWEKELYDRLRFTVPVIDAAIGKIVRLTGGYNVICEDESMQELMNGFVYDIPVGLTGKSLQSFTDSFLESLLTYGNAVGEMILDRDTMRIISLYNGDPSKIAVIADDKTGLPVYCMKCGNGKLKPLENQKLIMFSALNPPPGKAMGVSILRGLPSISRILMKIYRCIGQNYERAGNVRYAVTYRPSPDSGEKAYSRERAMQIAKEWSDGMTAAKNGEIRDFIAVGDVDIKVIGADNQLFDTETPVRQIMEQLVAKLSVPPFLLGLNWSSTERMSSQQADILTSELEYYRRIVTPVIKKAATAFLMQNGSLSGVKVEWENINLQDETSLAEARLMNAQAEEIERNLEN